MKNYLILTLLTIGFVGTGYSQCETFAGGTYGPVDGPCIEEPVSVNDAFEVWSGETYLFDNIEAGVSYAISLDTDTSTWPCDFTVFNASGGIDAFGNDGGGANVLSFTATESGQYAFGLDNTLDSCGAPTNLLNNGFATLSYVSGTLSSCIPPPPYCDVFGSTYGPGVAPCSTEPVSQFLNFQAWSSEIYVFTGVEAGVTYSISFENGPEDGDAESFVAELLVMAPRGAVDAYGLDGTGTNILTFTASESGDYEFGISDLVAGCGVTNFIDNGYATLSYVSGPISDCPSTCVAPTDLAVVENNFGGSNPTVNATWTNPEGTADCEVRGGRISPSSYAAGEPEFANIAQTRVINQTNGSTVNFNIALYNNPTISFIEGQRYGYDVRCQCSDSTGYSDWANITPASTFVVPVAPAGVVGPSVYKTFGEKVPMTTEELKAISQAKRTLTPSAKSLTKVSVNLFPNPASNELTISIDAPAMANLDIKVMDMSGRMVMVEQFNAAKGLNTMDMDVQNLESGVYVIAVDGVKHTFVKK